MFKGYQPDGFAFCHQGVAADHTQVRYTAAELIKIDPGPLTVNNQTLCYTEQQKFETLKNRMEHSSFELIKDGDEAIPKFQVKINHSNAYYEVRNANCAKWASEILKELGLRVIDPLDHAGGNQGGITYGNSPKSFLEGIIKRYKFSTNRDLFILIPSNDL